MYGYQRAQIGTMYSASRTASPIFPNKNCQDKSDIHIMSTALTIGEQNGVDLDDSQLEQDLDGELGIAGEVHDVPGGGIFGDIGKFAMKNLLGPAVQEPISSTTVSASCRMLISLGFPTLIGPGSCSSSISFNRPETRSLT